MHWTNCLVILRVGLTQPPLQAGFETPPAVRRTFVIMEECVSPEEHLLSQYFRC